MALAAVRPAAVDDVDEIVRIQAVTWEAAYAELLPPSALEQLRTPQAHQAWSTAVEAGPGYHVLVATEGEWTVGFCAATPAQAPEGHTPPADTEARPAIGPEHWAEIGVLLVEPRWGRRGHGGRLLATVAQELRESGSIFGLAWVPEADVASRRFYERAGWEPDGAVRVLDTGDSTLREVRITGSLDLKLAE
jgi:GNAT superfamily N-acetyltransferase